MIFGDSPMFPTNYPTDASYADWNARDDVRDQLLAIAAELEAAQ